MDFFGYKGAGKTIVMVLFALLLHLSSKKIISNIWVDFPFEWVNAKDIVELSPNLINSVVLLDEIHMIADSRQSTSLQNRCLSYFFLQSRHRDCDILYTTQQSGQSDIRIRKNTDIKVICENLKIDSDGDGHDDIIRVVINNIVDRKTTVFERVYIQPLFNRYSTKEIVNPFYYKDKKALKEILEKNQNFQDFIHKKRKEKSKKI